MVQEQLLDYEKQGHDTLILDTLILNVYQKNVRAVNFYEREGFVIVSEQADEDIGEFDFTMSWERKGIEEQI